MDRGEQVRGARANTLVRVAKAAASVAPYCAPVTDLTCEEFQCSLPDGCYGQVQMGVLDCENCK